MGHSEREYRDREHRDREYHSIKRSDVACLAAQVAINTTITDVNEFLNHIVSSTNMKCLTPPSALSGSCGFLAANLYAKSVFGEDALVNLSVEKGADGKLSGYIRIRSAPLTPWALSLESFTQVLTDKP